jgi:dTDP-glucose 4,6-dehydratase
MIKKILITGGAGFIGSHLVRMFVNRYPEYKIHNLDCLTYAGDLKNIEDVSNSKNYKFIKGDICDSIFIDNLFKKEKYTDVIHLAAESHVDNSISYPLSFAKTNILGTINLLEAFKISIQIMITGVVCFIT